MIHVTTRTTWHSPIYYASLAAAEVVERPTGYTLTVPLAQHNGNPMERARQFHQQLLTCVIEILQQNSQVSQIIVPSRFRLPDEWVWSARCKDEHIVYQNGSWVLIEKGKSHA
jgi:cell division inhibitor SulA